MNKQPFFSIITPTYNRAWCIEDRVVKSVLNQDYEDWELIIVDDGSTDDTSEIFKKYRHEQRIVYYRIPERRGAKAARNIGIDISKGEWIIFLDSDDELLDGALSLIKMQIDKIKDTNISSLRFNSVDDEGNIIARMPFEEAVINFDDNYFWDFIIREFNFKWEHLACVKAEIIKTNNLKFSEYEYLEYEFWLKLLKISPMKIIDIPLRKFNIKSPHRVSLRVNISKFKILSLNMADIIKLFESYKVRKEFIKTYKKNVLFNNYLQQAYYNLLSGDKKMAIKSLKKSLSYGKLSIKHIILLIGCCLPFKIIEFLYYFTKKMYKKKGL